MLRLPLSKRFDKPVVRLPDYGHIFCLFDTGASVAVWCSDVEYFKKSFPKAKDTDSKVWLSGFGGDGEIAAVYSIPEFDNPEDERDAEQCFGIDFGDEHSADPMRDSYSYHLICGSKKCVVISLHNHPSLSKISLVDVRFFLEHLAIKLLIAVTNIGNIYYLVKTNKFDRQKAIDLFNEAVSVNNKARGLKALQKASEYFLKSCHKAGIVYEDR